MADLTFKVQKITEMSTAALVQIDGAIDAKTVVHFQEKLDQLQKENYTHFILDMEGIKYVNSTGLGTLVNVADALETRGGGIALVKIHPKVKVVFDMLGLNAFFKIFSNEKEALVYFQKLGADVSFNATPPPAPKTPVTHNQTAPIPRQDPVSPPAPISSTRSNLNKVPPPATSIKKVKVSTPDPGSPYSLVCAVCKVKLNIPRPGSFKCPRCATFFKLYDNGEVIFSERKKASPLQMKLSCTDECMEGLSEFISVLSTRIGFSADEIRAIKDSIIETCSAVIEKAYDNKQYLSYNVVINPSSTELKIQISDYGKFIYDEDTCFKYSKQTMDEFEHRQHPKGGNIIDMVKKFIKQEF